MTHHTKLDPVYTGTQTSSQSKWYAVRKDDPEFKKKNRRKSALQRQKKKKIRDEITKDDECVDCGITQAELYPVMLQHDHRDDEIKLFNVGDGWFRYGLEKVLAERAKCDIRCHACHMKRHYGGK